MTSTAKNPTKVRAGTIGARTRWGDTPRVVRLDTLHPRVAAAIAAMVRAEEEAVRNAQAADKAAA